MKTNDKILPIDKGWCFTLRVLYASFTNNLVKPIFYGYTLYFFFQGYGLLLLLLLLSKFIQVQVNINIFMTISMKQ